jgi:hypothetical protein
MKREPLTQYMGLNMTASERAALERLAEEHGATLSGTIRKLIRDAARRSQLLVLGGDNYATTQHQQR